MPFIGLKWSDQMPGLGSTQTRCHLGVRGREIDRTNNALCLCFRPGGVLGRSLSKGDLAGLDGVEELLAKPGISNSYQTVENPI